MPHVRGEYAELLAPVLNLRTFEAYRRKPELYRQINNVRNSSRAYEDDFAMTGFGPLSEQGELQPTQLDEIIKLGGVRFFHKKYSLGFVISEEMRDDGNFDLFSTMAGALGVSSRHTVELFGHDVYNHAFDTDRYIGRDGEALISDSHPIPGTGDTISNMPTVNTDLSQAALEEAWADFYEQVDDRGIPIDLSPATLFVHPRQFKFAQQLLESSSVVTVGAVSTINSGIINPMEGWVTPFTSPYLIDPDAWFLLAPSSDIDVRFYWRKQMDTKTWDDDDADGTIHKVKQRHSNGFGDWRGVYGSPGY
jgi:phage major head subunit gpT-like protein